MNRRSLIKASASLATAVVAITAGAAAAHPTHLTRRDLITHGGRAIWTRDARSSPYAGATYETIDRIVQDGIIEITDKDGIAYIEHMMTLRDPRFEVDMGKTWNTFTGWDEIERSPRLRVFEGDVHIGDCHTFRYVPSPGSTYVPERPVGLRRPVVNIDALKARFPGQVEYDMRWLRHYAENRKGVGTGAT